MGWERGTHQQLRKKKEQQKEELGQEDDVRCLRCTQNLEIRTTSSQRAGCQPAPDCIPLQMAYFRARRQWALEEEPSTRAVVGRRNSSLAGRAASTQEQQRFLREKFKRP